MDAFVTFSLSRRARLTRNPRSRWRGRCLVATSLRDRKPFDEALEILRLNATMFPQSAMVQINLGDTAAQKGDLPLAERSYTRAIETEPGHAIALKSLEAVRARMRRSFTSRR